MVGFFYAFLVLRPLLSLRVRYGEVRERGISKLFILTDVRKTGVPGRCGGARVRMCNGGPSSKGEDEIYGGVHVFYIYIRGVYECYTTV